MREREGIQNPESRIQKRTEAPAPAILDSSDSGFWIPSPPRPCFYVLVGIPGSGKSTYARTVLPEAMRISLDDLRLMLSGRTFEVGVEPAVAVAAEALLQSLPAFCAAKGWDVVFDATNVTRARRAPLIATARQHGFKPVAIFVTGSLGAALKRNAARPFPVPTPAVLNFARRLEPPSLEEGFEEVVVVDTG